MSSLISKLRDQLEQNYDDFRKEMLSCNRETIFNSAMRIAAMGDVFFYMSVHDWVDESEAAYLLDFVDPLTLIAEAWEEHLTNGERHFRGVLDAILGNENNEELYMTLVQEREARESYQGRGSGYGEEYS